jgi:hypothetical protein
MKKIFWNYGLAILALLVAVLITGHCYVRLGIWGALVYVVSLIMVSGYAYTNGWHRGRFEAAEEEKKITQKVQNASSVRGKTKPKARR